MDRWTVHLRDEGGAKGSLKPATIHSYARAVNAFLASLREDGEDEIRERETVARMLNRYGIKVFA